MTCDVYHSFLLAGDREEAHDDYHGEEDVVDGRLEHPEI